MYDVISNIINLFSHSFFGTPILDICGSSIFNLNAVVLECADEFELSVKI